jgi:hypothetical protein
LALERKISEERIAKFIIFVDRIMLLPRDLDEVFNEFIKIKLNKFMRRTKEFDYRGTSSEFIMEYMYKKIYGVEAGDFAREHALRVKSEKERIKSERERVKSEKELEKERLKNVRERVEERLKIVQNLQEEGWTSARIADVLGCDLAWVEKSLKTKKKK